MRKPTCLWIVPVLLLIVGPLSLHASDAAAPATCQPMFNYQEASVPINNNCPTNATTFHPSTTAGDAKIVLGPLNSYNKACAYTTAVKCGGDDIMMSEIASINFIVTVPGNQCSANEWVAVYMFPKDAWEPTREVDFVETTGPNGLGGFASNWDANPVQVAWVNPNGGAVRVGTGAQQRVTFTSSGQQGGQYSWNTYVCGASEAFCDSGNALWHAYRQTGPDWFDLPMMIVLDDWGGQGGVPPQPGCTVEISDMVITKNSGS